VGVVDQVQAANVRWLSGYRHPRYLNEAHGARLREVFALAGPLMDGARSVGDPVAVLPTLFHLMWSRALVTELTGALLGPSTPIRAAVPG
jgi:hypothetical protein